MMRLLIGLLALGFAFGGSDAMAQTGTMRVTVQVEQGTNKRPVADSVVFLRAARPKGPFEPTDPKPEAEFSGFTNAEGIAVFDKVPTDLATQGLRLQAVTTFGGLTFKTAQNTPGPGLKLTLPVYEKGVSIDGLKIASLRTIVEPWEGYLVFTQYYQLTNSGKTAIDVSMLPGVEFEKGLPLEIHPLAKGIQASGPGESVVVNSTIYWKGSLNPGQSIPLQVRFSMTAKHPEYVYEQTMNYPVDKIELVVPVQTRFKKMPRLDKVTLAAPGFEMLSGTGILGLRNDLEFIGATGGPVANGDVFKFKLGGLPFERNYAPYIVFVLALIFGAMVLVFGHREAKRSKTSVAREELARHLENEREALLQELVALEGDLQQDEISEREYEVESIALRERLALVMKKLSDLGDDAA